jgi:TRAP-type C4-dicarboxylate transport system permease small subunit
MNWVKRIFGRVSSFGNVVASLFLGFTMMLMVGEITGRYIFSRPIPGSFEMVTMAMGVLTTIGFAFALERNIHIRVTIIEERLPRKGSQIAQLYVNLVGFLVMAVLFWQFSLSAVASLSILEHTAGVMKVPKYPIKFIMSFAVLLFCIGYLIRFFEGLRKVGKKPGS